MRDITDMLEFAFDDGNRDLFLRFYYKLDLKLKKAVVTKLLYGMPQDKSEPFLRRCWRAAGWSPGRSGK